MSPQDILISITAESALVSLIHIYTKIFNNQYSCVQLPLTYDV